MHLPKLRRKPKTPGAKKPKRQKNPLLQTPEYKHFRLLRYANAIVVLGVLAGAIYMGFFLYQTIYTTIGQVQNIIVIDSQIQGDIIDFASLESIEESWQQKYATTTEPIARDPFTYLAPPPAEPVVTSTPVEPVSTEAE